MKELRIAEILSYARDEYIEEAAPKRHSGGNHWRKWTAAAACLGLIVGILWLARSAGTDTPSTPVHINQGTGMGMEAYVAYDPSELVNGNPWSLDAQLTTLPVYRNLWPRSGVGEVPDRDPEAVQAFREEVEARLGTLASHAQITVEGGFSATVKLEPSLALPEEYRFRYDAAYDQMQAVAEYLLEAYGDIIAMEDPVVTVSGGDYDSQGNQSYEIGFFEGAGDLTEQIIHYHFHKVSFHCDGDGKLWIIRISQTDLSEKVGDYPIISPEEAEKLLKNGSYITTCPDRLTGSEPIGKVELVYRTGGKDSYYMPYYRFLVELPALERENGLKTYGAYYVPALEAHQLAAITVWDDSFN